jgi:hypothetical protein
MMRPIKSSRTILGTRRAWEPPAVTKLPIGTETKSAGENARSVGSAISGFGQPKFAHPQPPAPPATKLGFSFEMSFPLSARTDG